MQYSFDLSDKNVEYALVQFASKLKIDVCLQIHAFIANCKSTKVTFVLDMEVDTDHEWLLIYSLIEHAPDSEYVKGRKLINQVSELSRKQLIALDDKVLLGIQRGIETADIHTTRFCNGIFVSTGLATWGRSTSFAQDEKFNRLIDKYSDLLPLPNWHWNLSVAKWCVETTLKLDGDLVELGVFKGHTTAFVADYVDFAKQAKNWYLYDTFAGIPVEDMNNETWIAKNEYLYEDTYTYNEVVDRFKEYSNIHVIRGRVPDVFQEHAPPSRISFLHIDLNSANAEEAALKYIYDSVVPGGIILFDDYGWEACDEQHQAINRWAKEKALSILELPTGQGLLFVTG